MASPAGGLSRHSERSLSQFLDPITKLGTLLILGSYAIGYLIVVINEQSHGFLETSLFKPRAITAGAVFILFLGLPFAITEGTFFKKGETNDESPFEAGVRFLLGVTDYLVACSAAAIGMMLVSVDQFHGPSAKPRTSVAFLVLMWVVAANSHLRFSAPKSYHRHPIAWTVFAIVCLGALIFSFYTLRGLAIFRYFGWMFVVATVENAISKDARKGFTFKPLVLTLTLLGAISFYATRLFPFMNPTWGGGAPLPTVIYVSKDSPVHPKEKLKADLIESSESAFYVVFEGETQTTYVPRELVIAMEFSARPQR